MEAKRRTKEAKMIPGGREKEGQGRDRRVGRGCLLDQKKQMNKIAQKPKDANRSPHGGEEEAKRSEQEAQWKRREPKEAKRIPNGREKEDQGSDR